MKFSTALATAHHLIGWSLLVLLVGIVFVSQAQAAEIPSSGLEYIIGASSTSCSSPPLVTLQTRVLSAPALAIPLINWYASFDPSFLPATVTAYSTTIIPTDGSCATATLTLTGAGSYTVYFKIISRVDDPHGLSIEGAQQIQTAVLLLFAIAWGVRAAARLGTHHHD